ncbi:MAG: 1-acyl-sn-glycerol-3-phosphate acyltransferase [Candidatus Nanoarchaeia archaeon]|nr:1-acyl-sn-glycerol-3-phosphate acyltransferase [Candidatus Nanoarchaeia archaeon]
MDYIQRFLSDEEPKKLSSLEKMLLTASALKQIDSEMLNSKYQHKLNELYYPEEKIVNWLDTLNQSYLWQFFEKYFKPRLYNAENIPDKTGAMLIANHSTIFLADLAPVYFGVHEQKRRCVYGMAYKMFGQSDFLKTIGGVIGKMENAVKLLNDDKLLIVCPGGILDACKPFYERYLVRPVEGFAPENCGYIKAAYKAGKPIIPVGIIGAEETLFTLTDMKPFVKKVMGWLDEKYSLSKKPRIKELYGLVDFAKIIPLPLNLLPFRSNVEGYAGQPIDVRKIVGENPVQEDYARANSVVMQSLQTLIDKGLGKRRDCAMLSGIVKDIIEVS